MNARVFPDASQVRPSRDFNASSVSILTGAYATPYSRINDSKFTGAAIFGVKPFRCKARAKAIYGWTSPRVPRARIVTFMLVGPIGPGSREERLKGRSYSGY